MELHELVAKLKALAQDLNKTPTLREFEKSASMLAGEFTIPIEIWVKTLYETGSIYKQWKMNRMRLLNLMVPLYFGRVASFINRTIDMNSMQAEEFIGEQAVVFEELKDYLVEKWSETREEPNGL